MKTSEAELKNFLEEIHHSDVVRGLFLVFDNIFSGFALSEIYEYEQDEESKELSTNVVAKIASFADGMFHLAKYKQAEEIWLVVGQVHGLSDEGRYNLKEMADFAISEYYDQYGIFGDEEGVDEEDNEGDELAVFVTQWQKHIATCLDDPKKLRKALKRISVTLQQYTGFLLECDDRLDFSGMAADEGMTDGFTDKNLEILFKVFVNRINKDILPKLVS